MSTDLVPVTAPSVLLPVSSDDAKAAMRAYQEVTTAILEPSDWQGQPGKQGSFVKKSGWRKIAKAYSLSTELISQDVDRDENGVPRRAQAVVRASAPNGQRVDGVGYCSADEARFRPASGRQKLENDLRATAATRAANRAISDLVGYGQVSAEEMGDTVESHAVELVEAGSPELERTGRALMALYGDEDEDRAQNALDAIVGDLQGQLPVMVARALQRAAQHRPRPAEPEAEVVDAEPVEEAGS